MSRRARNRADAIEAKHFPQADASNDDTQDDEALPQFDGYFGQPEEGYEVDAAGTYQGD